MTIQIASAEQFARTVRALDETLKMIASEMLYPEHLRPTGKVARLEAHKGSLASALRIYLEAGGKVQ
jgi:hypothetical protein